MKGENTVSWHIYFISLACNQRLQGKGYILRESNRTFAANSGTRGESLLFSVTGSGRRIHHGQRQNPQGLDLHQACLLLGQFSNESRVAIWRICTNPLFFQAFIIKSCSIYLILTRQELTFLYIMVFISIRGQQRCYFLFCKL